MFKYPLVLSQLMSIGHPLIISLIFLLAPIASFTNQGFLRFIHGK
jgi:hypothetical protein